MKYQSLLIISFFFLLLVYSCKKDNASKLPPPTQTGENTFGCLVNGEAYVPKGFDGTGRPNPHIQFDYGFNGQPYLTIDVIQYEKNNAIGDIFIGFGNLTRTGYYSVPIDFTFLVAWKKLGNCNTPPFDSTLQKYGGGIITKLDIPNRIVSGTFDFKYKTTNCDTVRITDGRFDIKF